MISGFEEIRRTYVRKQLYEEVWSQPMTRIAKVYGVSDSAVRKACVKLNVPTPGVGYWAKLAYGKAPVRPALPAWDGPEEITCTEYKPIRDAAASQASEGTDTEPQADGKRVVVVPVPATLTSPHKLVAETLRALRRRKPDPWNHYLLRDREHLDVRVSVEQVDRAMRIMDGLLKALEARGYTVAVNQDGHQGETVVRINGGEVSIRLREGLRQVPQADAAGQNEDDILGRREEHVLVPSGQLRLGVQSERTYGFKEIESDGKKRRIEERLAHFVTRLEGEAALVKQREAERKEHARREHETQVRKMEERQRIDGLEREMAAWEKSQRIRAYIAAVKEMLKRKYRVIPIGCHADRWLKWARRYADSVDPLVPKPTQQQST